MLGALLGLVGLVVVVLAVMVAVGVIIYNGLVGLRNRVRNAWSQVPDGRPVRAGRRRRAGCAHRLLLRRVHGLDCQCYDSAGGRRSDRC